MIDQPPSQYPVGSIVNGHVWTGKEWVPAQVMPAPQQFKEPMSAKFDRLPVALRVVIVIGAAALAVAAYMALQSVGLFQS